VRNEDEPRAGGAAPRRRVSRRRGSKSELAKIEELVASLRPSADEVTRRYVVELVHSATRLLEDRTPVGDVKLVNAAMRELRYALAVFSRHQTRRKVTTFGSARTPAGTPAYEQARHFAKRIADEGFDVITGAGSGIMRACQEGAGRERSFGLNIRLPFEQQANEFIAGDEKLVTFRYFFTRKLLFVKEASAVVMFPGGFGTHDEAFEVMTLVQTGKAPVVPILFVDAPGGTFWKDLVGLLTERLLRERLISPEDVHLFRVTDDVEDAVGEILGFYRVFHSSRYVGEELVIRLNRPPEPGFVERLAADFHDIVAAGGLRVSPALPEEEDTETPHLPRLVFAFDRMSYGRLRQLIDALNEMP
jgi:uncharacterized protein (TIGR00730 family)